MLYQLSNNRVLIESPVSRESFLFHPEIKSNERPHFTGGKSSYFVSELSIQSDEKKHYQKFQI